MLEGVSIEQYQPQLHRWLTIAQLPDLGQLSLNLEPEKAQEIDRRLQQQEIVEFTAMTTVMNIDICDRYVFIPLLEQPDLYSNTQSKLWGRICLLGNFNSIWTAQDLSWVQALGQQLLTAMSMLAGFTTGIVTNRGNSSTLSELVELIEKIAELESVCDKKDDFINKVGWGLNLVFSSCVGYPTTRWIIKEGAQREHAFKYTQRRHQIPTEVWYKAYPGLTAIDLARNSRIRQGVQIRQSNDAEISEWLSLI